VPSTVTLAAKLAKTGFFLAVSAGADKPATHLPPAIDVYALVFVFLLHFQSSVSALAAITTPMRRSEGHAPCGRSTRHSSELTGTERKPLLKSRPRHERSRTGRGPRRFLFSDDLATQRGCVI